MKKSLNQKTKSKSIDLDEITTVYSCETNKKVSFNDNNDSYYDFELTLPKLDPFTTHFNLVNKLELRKSVENITEIDIDEPSNYNSCDDKIIDFLQLQQIKINNTKANNLLTSNFKNIKENLFIGNLNSIKNERKMCQLGIQYLIDLTNLQPVEFNRRSLGNPTFFLY
jgi:hypothetical protein